MMQLPKQNRIKTTPTAEEPPLIPANGYSLRREHVQRQAAAATAAAAH